MFRAVLLFYLFSPLLGIYLMEQGAFGMDIGMKGHPNGATFAYFIYLVAFGISFYIFKGNRLFKIKINSPKMDNQFVKRRFIVAIYVQIIFILIMLFGFGAIKVWLGLISKGDFRGSFGFFGPFAYYISNLFAPALMAYLAALYKKYRKLIPGLGTYLLINIGLVFVLGSVWGFKSTSIAILMPAAILYWNRISLAKLAMVFVLVFSSFVFFSGVFDDTSFKTKDITETITDFSVEKTFDVRNFNSFSFVLYRLTVIQGNTPWRVWDLYSSGEEMPSYAKTLPAIMGDKFLALGGIDANDRKNFTDYHYSFAVTNLVGRAEYFLDFGHNVTATAFTDGVLIGGMFGVAIIGLVAGFLTRAFADLISRARLKDNPIFLSIILVYFTSYYLGWLNSGGVTAFIHISVFVGLFLTYLFLKTFDRIK